MRARLSIGRVYPSIVCLSSNFVALSKINCSKGLGREQFCVLLRRFKATFERNPEALLDACRAGLETEGLSQGGAGISSGGTFLPTGSAGRGKPRPYNFQMQPRF